MYHIVQPHGGRDDFSKATVVASVRTLQEAWEHLDALHQKMSQNNVDYDYLMLVVVDEQRRAVARPTGMVS
jgi:hypothetical protein